MNRHAEHALQNLKGFQKRRHAVRIADFAIELMRFGVRRKTIDMAPNAAVFSKVLLDLLHESQTESLTATAVLNVQLQDSAVLRWIRFQEVIFCVLRNRSGNAADDRAIIISKIDHTGLLTHLFEEPSDIPLRIKIIGPSGPVEIVQRSDIRLQLSDSLDERWLVSIPIRADFH